MFVINYASIHFLIRLSYAGFKDNKTEDTLGRVPNSNLIHTTVNVEMSISLACLLDSEETRGNP